MVMATAECKVPGFEEVILAEAFGLLLIMCFAIDCGFRKVLFEGDTERDFSLIQNDNTKDRSYLGSMIKEIQDLQSHFATYDFRFIHRERNIVAHKLAHLAQSDPNKIWFEEVPKLLIDVYFHDLLN
jgi:hypothetical protein